MAEPEGILRLDGVDYPLADMSDEARALVVRLKDVDRVLSEKTNLLAVLRKARNGYIDTLKAEIIQKKSGVDLGALFDGD